MTFFYEKAYENTLTLSPDLACVILSQYATRLCLTAFIMIGSTIEDLHVTCWQNVIMILNCSIYYYLLNVLQQSLSAINSYPFIYAKITSFFCITIMFNSFSLLSFTPINLSFDSFHLYFSVHLFLFFKIYYVCLSSMSHYFFIFL